MKMDIDLSGCEPELVLSAQRLETYTNCKLRIIEGFPDTVYVWFPEPQFNTKQLQGIATELSRGGPCNFRCFYGPINQDKIGIAVEWVEGITQ